MSSIPNLGKTGYVSSSTTLPNRKWTFLLIGVFIILILAVLVMPSTSRVKKTAITNPINSPNSKSLNEQNKKHWFTPQGNRIGMNSHS